MRIIISDASALIDLAKVRLLEALIALPYDFVIPDVIFETELLRIDPYTREDLGTLGFRIGTLSGDQLTRAIAVNQEQAALSTRDCFAFVLAYDTEGCILLTGDGKLRACAEAEAIETHGVLWACDEMERHGTTGPQALLMALRALDRDPLVRLPRGELRSRLRRLERQLGAG
jgi:predicted nucleic acid-binding protein